MMRTSLSSRGYGVLKAEIGPTEVASLMKELTMVPLVSAGSPTAGSQQQEFPLFLESKTKIYVPKYFGLQRYGLPRTCRVSDGAPMSDKVAFAGALRPEQRGPVDAFVEAARDPMRMGGIISLPCGGGKTITALFIAALLGRKTLIIVHKDFLLNQWRERIAEFLPAASVGLIKAKVTDVAGRDIVIASLQSLSMKEYADDILSDVGLLIVDECHRVGTEVFSRALHKVNVRYSLGLSATVDRKDGMTKAFVAFLGDVVYRGQRRSDTVTVVQARFFDPDPEYCREETISIGKPNVSRMINNICAFESRTDFIVDSIMRVLAAEPERKVLILSDRKAQLRALKERVEARGVTAGFYWGGMKPKELAESETKQVMCATYSYAAEGMDVPDLDTLFMTSPKSDIEQSCGRILRQKADVRVRQPLIVDVVDEFSLFSRQGFKRRAFYKKHGYSILSTIDAFLASSRTSGDDEEGEAEPMPFSGGCIFDGDMD